MLEKSFQFRLERLLTWYIFVLQDVRLEECEFVSNDNLRNYIMLFNNYLYKICLRWKFSKGRNINLIQLAPSLEQIISHAVLKWYT